ncbi:hypothetical protein FJY69_10820 [candidate division WOR-3 bacterium]|nr:hypothetical protein [candidate division WOR-3 bacterium]
MSPIRVSALVLLAAATTGSAAQVDIGVDSILRYSLYTPGDWLTPKATWHNYGDTAASFTAWFTLYDPAGNPTYRESVDVTALAPGSVDTLVFLQVQFTRAGTWTGRCSTFAPGDTIQVNDTLSCRFWVVWG